MALASAESAGVVVGLDESGSTGVAGELSFFINNINMEGLRGTERAQPVDKRPKDKSESEKSFFMG